MTGADHGFYGVTPVSRPAALPQFESELLAKATTFRFQVGPKPYGDIEIARRSYDEDSWAIVGVGRGVLNNKGEWEGELLPSSRTDDFKQRCRFRLRDAVAMVKRLEYDDKTRMLRLPPK